MTISRLLTGRRIAGLVAAAVLTFAGVYAAQADTKAQLLRCSDTSFSTYYTTISCGGDPLTVGGIGVVPPGPVHVLTRGANPLNLYEVYYLPIGAATTAAVKVGNFMTDCSGNVDTLLRSLSRPSDISSAPVTIQSVLGRTREAGNFIVYSRGPYGTDTDGDCRADTWNTSDGTMSGTFANPTVNTASDIVQFISGFSVP